MTVVAKFEIHYSPFLDEHGKIVQPLPEFAHEPQNLIALYRWMALMRGVTRNELLLYWGGDERGSTFAVAPRETG